MTFLPIGKLPPALLDSIISKAPILDPRVILGPGTGIDCAVIDNGETYLVMKTDPITFTSENIGWYVVQINVNDIVTTGATPKWMLATVLLPENQTTNELVDQISQQLFNTCKEFNISFVGGHTEVTHDLNRPIIAATLIGEVRKEDFISPRNMKTGDKILITKGIPIEATGIIASNFEVSLNEILTTQEIQLAKNYLHNPGISVHEDANLARECGGVTAMHDPTEGGLAAALWELSVAGKKKIVFYPDLIPISEISRKICQHFNLNPFNLIASGALLITASPNNCTNIIKKLISHKIEVKEIGSVQENGEGVFFSGGSTFTELLRPDRDELAKLYDAH
jgi:hydrogenase maturation factor